MKTTLRFFCIVLVGVVLISCEEILNNPTAAEIASEIEGTWECDESSSVFKSATDIYMVYISPDENDSTLVYISNFYALGNGIEAKARVSGYTLSLFNQTLTGGYIVQGTGTISTNLKSISWNYSVDDGSGIKDDVVAKYTYRY
ncbi:MAG: hypothetical protein JXB34_14905 [Bacteroidales bacterium]|nr:hypothetical protein [Bacteroidales bacterium]